MICRQQAAVVVSLSARRAWIEIQDAAQHNTDLQSLSARRAWIEITGVVTLTAAAKGSLSARRAWIEIDTTKGHIHKFTVALRKESVDRNLFGLDIQNLPFCRSPQGERG